MVHAWYLHDDCKFDNRQLAHKASDVDCGTVSANTGVICMTVYFHSLFMQLIRHRAFILRIIRYLENLEFFLINVFSQGCGKGGSDAYCTEKKYQPRDEVSTAAFDAKVHPCDAESLRKS